MKIIVMVVKMMVLYTWVKSMVCYTVLVIQTEVRMSVKEV
ncbi:unnamed protein product [Brassica oleracea]